MKKSLITLVLFTGVALLHAQKTENFALGSRSIANNQVSAENKEATTIWEQKEDRTGVYVFGTVNTRWDGLGYGIYIADDFELDQPTKITKLKLYLSHGDEEYYESLIGYNINFYNDKDGVPDNNPHLPNTGVIELKDIPSDHLAVTTEPGIEAFLGYKVLTIDLEKLNKDFSLPKGKYWISMYSNMNLNDNANYEKRSIWVQSFNDHPLAVAKLIEPTNKSGIGATTWTDINKVGMDMKSLAFTIFGEKTLFVNEIDQKGFHVYPNPTKDFIQIESPLNHTIFEIKIFDHSGKLIMTKKDNTTIDIKHLSKGNYLLQIKTSEGIITKKIIKQ